MKKYILNIFAFCYCLTAFGQIPPVNVWTPGGGNIYFNGGNVGIGLNSPLYPLHVNGFAFFSKGIHAQAIATSILRTDTLAPGTIGGQRLVVLGATAITGGLFSPSVTVAGLAGVGEREVFVDTSGNLTVARPLNPSSYASCTNTNPAWRIGGNNVGSRTGANIGTCDYYDFILKANNTEYMWLKPDGKLGIGTSAPAAMVHIDILNGSALGFNISNSGTNLFTVGNDGSTHIYDADPNQLNSLLTMTHSNGSALKFLANGAGDIASSTSLSMHFAGGTNNDFGIYQGTPGSGIQHFYMAGGTGSSYFRTTDPNANGTAFMVVNDPGTGNNQVFKINNDGSIISSALAGTGNRTMLIDPQGKIIPGGVVTGTSIYWELGGTDVATAAGSNIFPNNAIGPVDAGTDFVFITGGVNPSNERMRITAAGNTYLTVSGGATKAFSIVNSLAGTSICGSNESFSVFGDGKTFIGGHLLPGSFSGALLQVSGQIAAKEVHVLAPSFWCDYVFSENYKLRTIYELENFYKKNKHLPDVPSESEVKENGVDMATMDAVLLKKIEESTLYIVQQQKEIDIMKGEMEKMKKENEEVKKILIKLLEK